MSEASSTPFPLRGIVVGRRLAALVAAWTLFGLVGHDPWKPDEAHYFGVVLDLLHGGDWVVPTLAGEPWIEKPPLFYVVAAAFASAGKRFFALHDAARLSTGFFILVAAFFLASTARELYGRVYGAAAVMLMLGCIGAVVRMHQLITDVALLAGIAIGMYGLAISKRALWTAGIALGVGAACAFLSKGLLGPGWLAITAMLMPVCKAWRTRRYIGVLVIAFVFAAVPAAFWMIELYDRSPELFYVWLVDNNFGRFFGFVRLGVHNPPGFYAYTVIWYAVPCLPLIASVAWTAWRQHTLRALWEQIQLPAILAAVMLTVLSLASESRELYLMPIVLPLSLATAASIEGLSRKATRVLSSFARVAFGGVALLLWLGWLALTTGTPHTVSDYLLSYQPAFVPTVRWARLALAICVTAVSATFLRRHACTAGSALTQWTVGVTLCWALTATLWMPFLDAGKSYRDMVHSLAAALPESGCLASIHLGEPQRALLNYFAGVTTVRLEVVPSADCPALLVQSRRTMAASAPDRAWTLVWEGARAGDKEELYRLYRRDQPVGHVVQQFPRGT